MLFIISYDNENDTFKIFDNILNISMNYSLEALKNIIGHRPQLLANLWSYKACRNGGMMPVLSPICQRMISEPNSYKYIVVEVRSDKTYKVIDKTGNLKIGSHADYIKNQMYSDTINIEDCKETLFPLKFTGAVNIKIIRNQREQIEKKYEAFIAKATLLGMDLKFKYEVTGSEVILQDYEGTSKNIIVPGFVTAIDKSAFYGREITDVKLNAGLKVIGPKAFKNNRIRSISIPDTVSLIYTDTFENNRHIENGKLIYLDKQARDIAFQNPNTVILNY